ncbi:hypothetical protein N7507_003170 [Penicillium longicatenatum]|nr:hypothetical protein N7507_003170 [Penicillium longicatenatum]
MAWRQRLLSSFRGFFARGSARDFCELLPDSSAERSRFSSPRNTSSKGREYIGSPAKKAKSSSSQQSPHENPSTDIESSGIKRTVDTNFEIQEAWTFLVTQASSEAQVHRLMKVLEGVLEAPKQTEIFYRRLWSAYKTQIFGCHESSKSRIVRLFQGRKVIDQEAQRFECAGRFSLVFLTHDIEVIKAQDWKLAPGQSRQHAAVMSISKQLNVEPDEIKKEWRRSRNYVKLLEELGPASLLELGTGVNW